MMKHRNSSEASGSLLVGGSPENPLLGGMAVKKMAVAAVCDRRSHSSATRGSALIERRYNFFTPSGVTDAASRDGLGRAVRTSPSHSLTRVLSPFKGGISSSAKRTQKFVLLILAMVFLAVTPFAAQTKKPEKPAEQRQVSKPMAIAGEPQVVSKIFQIKHADVDKLAEVLRIFGHVKADRDLRVIAVQVPPGVLPTVEETVRRLDMPPPTPQNVELTVHLLVASNQDGDSGSVPPDLDPVVKQLKVTFPFKSFRTLDTLVVRSRDKQNGVVKGLARFDANAPQPSSYTFSYRAASILSDEKGHSIRIDQLRLMAGIQVRNQPEGSSTGSYQTIEAGFNTDIDVREGQRVVVGKAAIGGTDNALILVITAKVLE
jgi:hypothetical protein